MTVNPIAVAGAAIAGIAANEKAKVDIKSSEALPLGKLAVRLKELRYKVSALNETGYVLSQEEFRPFLSALKGIHPQVYLDQARLIRFPFWDGPQSDAGSE